MNRFHYAERMEEQTIGRADAISKDLDDIISISVDIAMLKAAPKEKLFNLTNIFWEVSPPSSSLYLGKCFFVRVFCVFFGAS